MNDKFITGCVLDSGLLKGRSAEIYQALSELGVGTSTEIFMRIKKNGGTGEKDSYTPRYKNLVSGNYITVGSSRLCRVNKKLSRVFEITGVNFKEAVKGNLKPATEITPEMSKDEQIELLKNHIIDLEDMLAAVKEEYYKFRVAGLN